MHRNWWHSFPPLHKLSDERRRFISLGINREVSCVENVNLCDASL